MTSDVDQKILTAFAKLVNQFGYRGSTTRKIAATAGINESTLFRHFSDKQSILRRLIDDYSKEVSQVGETFQLSGDAKHDLTRAVSIYQYFIENHQPVFQLVLRENYEFPELSDILNQLFILQSNLMTTLLQKMIAANEIKADINIEIEVQNLMLMNFGHSVFKYVYTENPQKVDNQKYLNDNIRVFIEHLLS